MMGELFGQVLDLFGFVLAAVLLLLLLLLPSCSIRQQFTVTKVAIYIFLLNACISTSCIAKHILIGKPAVLLLIEGLD